MSEAETLAIICANPDCRIAETGKCVEGMEREKCPHFGHAPAETVSAAPTKDGIPLSPGGTLDTAGAAQVLRANEARVIAIIGPSDAGKTSLIAGLYDLFQDGPVAGLEFTGSLSLHELEHVCHDARAASRRGTPHINRTPRGDVRFYHIDVTAPGQARISLVLGDRAGEEYRGAIDDISVVPEFVEVARADSITVLADGERMLDAGLRHNLRNEINLILQALTESGALSERPRLAIVLTKLDLVSASEDRARAEADFAAVVKDIQTHFSNTLSAVRAFRIAASPKEGTERRGTGVPELLTFWLEESPVDPTVPPLPPQSDRIFALLKSLDEDEAQA